MSLAEPARPQNPPPELGPAEFRRIAALLREIAGISLAEGKAAHAQARLSRRLRALGLPSFAAYCDLVEGRGRQALAERRALVSAMTTHVTRFFREPHHFETLRREVLPGLAERAAGGGRVRLWSAGCSTGEEAWSIALETLAALPDAPRRDLRILATDLDPAALETAARGRYPAAALGSAPPCHHARFGPAGEDGARAIAPAARALVAFRQLNLTRPWPMRGRFDVIFCRNVVIYFDDAAETALWRGFAERLLPGGWLFIGHSERINTSALPMFAPAGVSTYRRL